MIGSVEAEYARIRMHVALLSRECNAGRKPKVERVQSRIVYQHPDGHTWDGKGRAPKWIRGSEKSGLSRAVWRVTY